MSVFVILPLAFLCLLVVVDFLLRWPLIALRFYYGPDHYYYERCPAIPKNQRHTPGVDLSAGVVSDLSYILGRRNKSGPCRYVTDRFGYRNLVNGSSALPDTVVLGNSFVNASKSDQQMILSEQLNRIGVQSYNIAVNGINLWEELLNLKYQFRFNPRMSGVKQIVWAIFEGNALDGDFHQHTGLERMMATPGKQLSVVLENYYKRSVLRRLYKIFLKKKPVRDVVLSCDLNGQEMLFYKPYVKKLQADEQHVRRHGKMPAVESIFMDMADFAQDHGLEILCLFIPMKTRVYEWVLRQEEPKDFEVRSSPVATVMKELSVRHGFTFLDLTPVLSREAKRLYAEGGRLVYWHDDTHWNDVGIALSAAEIARALGVAS